MPELILSDRIGRVRSVTRREMADSQAVAASLSRNGFAQTTCQTTREAQPFVEARIIELARRYECGELMWRNDDLPLFGDAE